MQSASFELLDEESLVIDNFDTAPPSLSHGDLVFDPRSALFQGGGDDAEHPTVITMSRVRLASDTCDLYFSYIKVNLLLYTCSLDPFKDGILLDTPLVCMHRYCRSFRTTRKSASSKEHLHHPRGKRGSEDGRRRSCGAFNGQMTDKTPDVRRVPAPGRRTLTRRPAPPVQSQNLGSPTPSGRPDPRERPDV